MNKITVAIAGSSQNTLTCTKSLIQNPKFSISWILTPKPKPVGRKKIVTKNPMHDFAVENNIPVILVDKKIDENTKSQILHPKSYIPNPTSQILHPKSYIPNPTSQILHPNFLLVIDFGFLIPSWLIKHPKNECLNIHPSDLPRWRGSSPAQFSILFGDSESAITLMRVASKLDCGDIFEKIKFKVNASWTQKDYYQSSFKLIAKKLPSFLTEFVQHKTKPKPQPIKSPTVLARKLTKKDAYIDWKTIQTLLKGQIIKINISNLLSTTEPISIVRASKAFYPWPILWTKIPTKKGVKNMQIINCHLKNKKLVLDEVKIEGMDTAKWREVKNVLDS
jgi:methionyl-tRNA formyltransferase